MFMCRWMNGDVSFVSARTKDDAIVILDEGDMPKERSSFRFGISWSTSD